MGQVLQRCGGADYFNDVALVLLGHSRGGVWLVTAALVGYLWRPLVGAQRFLFAIAGMAMVVPMHTFAGGIHLDLAGIGLGVALVLAELVRSESSPMSRARRAPPA